MANHWTATAPDSRFTAGPVLNRILPDGDVSLTGRRLVRRRSGGGTQREIGDPAAYRAALAEGFGLELSEEEVAALGVFA
jgi:N-hydroxyarylamine O-acetyltransferase